MFIPFSLFNKRKCDIFHLLNLNYKNEFGFLSRSNLPFHSAFCILCSLYIMWSFHLYMDTYFLVKLFLKQHTFSPFIYQNHILDILEIILFTILNGVAWILCHCACAPLIREGEWVLSTAFFLRVSAHHVVGLAFIALLAIWPTLHWTQDIFTFKRNIYIYIYIYIYITFVAMIGLIFWCLVSFALVFHYKYTGNALSVSIQSRAVIIGHCHKIQWFCC
jgi:hypothetical protein